jgi:serine/threonine-protein kinase SRPK3
MKQLEKFKSQYLTNIKDSFIYETKIGKHVCIVLELLGCTLYDLIKAKRLLKDDNLLSFSDIKRVCFQILSGIKIIHNSFKGIHTDIKPENILIDCPNYICLDIIKKLENNNDVFNKIKKRIILLTQTNKLNNKNIKEIIEALFKIMEISNFILDDPDQKNIIFTKKNDDKCDEDINVLNNEENLLLSSESIYENDENITIDDEQLKNYQKIADIVKNKEYNLKISDFGNVIKKKYTYGECQTRHYRCPEVIIDNVCDNKCDIWSFGCTLYELITTRILFDPIYNDKLNSNRHHIYDMISKLGFDTNFLSFKKSNIYFANNNNIKGEYEITNKLIYSELLDIKNFSTFELCLFIDIIKKTLTISNLERYNVDSCLKHLLFY